MLCHSVFFSFYRELFADGNCEMFCKLSIGEDLLRDQKLIPYKYVVYSPKTREEDDYYEYLHDYSETVYRCLRIPPKQLQSGK